jgi:hypothetical protein
MSEKLGPMMCLIQELYRLTFSQNWGHRVSAMEAQTQAEVNMPKGGGRETKKI